MIDQEQLQNLTESYLKSIISEVSGSVISDFDSSAPFGEIGIDSFHVIKIIRRLETDFGTLPKSLLFENFTINDLANYFVSQHEPTLAVNFAKELHGTNGSSRTNGHKVSPVEVFEEDKPVETHRVNGTADTSAPIRVLEKNVYVHPELQELVQTLYAHHKRESSVSRGTRKIAPNLFIGSARRGYFNYARNKDLILAYAYTGPQDYLPVILDEMHQYCRSINCQLNIMADGEIPLVGNVAFSTTPFGVGQRILNLKKFTVEGGAMRRLRYQISKFQKCGVCRTQEYRCGSDSETDRDITTIVERWCEARKHVNPLVHEFREEILAGTLNAEHRLFLTYLDDILQNVILITAMCPEENGYLMDLEFYPSEMPLGGLEFAIMHIINVLVGEGCDVLSLGATLGCKLNSSPNADPEIDKILDDLREQNMFNDEGNFQFKNKFRPENKDIFLCRPVGSGTPDTVLDIVMMIADPLKNQTLEEENYDGTKARREVAILAEPSTREPSGEVSSGKSERILIDGHRRSRILSDFGFNPLNLPHEHVEFDLKTDSWAQLQMPSIEAQMKSLHSQLQQPASVHESLKAVFPFAHFVLTGSGQAAEDIFFKAWPKRGLILQNLLFPSTIFHQIDKGFTNKELPDPALFDLNSHNQYKANMDWEALQVEVGRDPASIAMVCIEVGNNAAGGCPVSLQHLRNVKTLLAQHSIPLVIDGTRVVENAQFLIEQDRECVGKSVWTVVREVLSLADALIGSLTKDFCVNKGGIIASNDFKLFHRWEELVDEAGSGVDLIDRKVIALSLQNRKQIEAKVLRRMEAVRLVWHALREHKVPVVQPIGGHCVLIDVKQIAEFKDFKYPVASFLAWMYVNTGIRAAAHSAGMQKHTSINDLVRLAIPVGMPRDQVDSIIGRLLDLFNKKANIPEIVLEGAPPNPLNGMHANYRLVGYHKIEREIISGVDFASIGPGKEMADTTSSIARLAGNSSEPPERSSSVALRPGKDTAKKSDTRSNPLNGRRPRVEDIAIIGMAGRYPKAKNLRELWVNLRQAKDCIEEVPAKRYELRLKQGATKKYRGGFIDDVDKFDSLFFNISPREAAILDPQERLFLEVAWEAIEDAGYYPEILAGEDGSRNIGVFVGAVWAMYQMFDAEEDQMGKKIKPNSFFWSIANRVSYWMNLTGPSLTLDTACSSSLTALYLACEAIHAEECSAAIVGGVNLDLHEAKLDINLGGGGLSKDGACRSFGKGADGYVTGEGIGALFLKPLDRAIRDKDNIYGLIKSAVVNHGGHASGYTVPNPKAQTKLILSAFEKANVDARSISYVEAHGTGTELGDPIEISGLSSAFESHAVGNQTCAVGSIKSNIGHLEAAAGVVSVSKVLLQMKHRQLVPSLHSSQLNEFIDFEHSPFYVVQRVEDWKSRKLDGVQIPLRAGISSFGAGGANAHVILESYEPLRKDVGDPAPANELVFPLSAKTEDQLRETAVRLAKTIEECDDELMDVAYTLQVGRKSFEHRLAIRATTKEELLEKLACFLNGKKSEGIACGHGKNSESVTRLLNRKEKEEFIRLLAQSRSPYELAELWVEGLFADWRGFQPNSLCKRVSLPTYPFADKRHWVGKKSSTIASLQSAAAVHPMLDTNESTFERQLFKKTFNDRDFFIYDHQVADIPTLPGVAYLELARKAGEIAAGRKVQKIKNVVWISPISVRNATPKEVFIELKPNDTTVRFEVFSYDTKGSKVPHSQGVLLYATKQEEAAEPEFIDLQAIRARCAKAIVGSDAYPRFKSFGLSLGPSFQVLQEVYKNESEILGVLKLPDFRQNDLQSMVLHPSLVDGSMQAGMSAHLGEELGEMFVPFSIGEVEVLHPLPSNCFSYATEMQGDKRSRESTRFVKSDVLIVDETGKVLVKIHESVGVPLREVHKKAGPDGEVDGFSKLYYSQVWEDAPLVEKNPPQFNSDALVLFDAQGTLRDLYRERRGREGKSSDQVILVQPGDSFLEIDRNSYKIDPQNKEDYTRLFQSLLDNKCAIENICFAWPVGHPDALEETGVNEALVRGVYSFLFVCQSLIQLKLESKVQLLYLYSTKQEEIQPANASVSGFIKALRLEHPKLLCKVLEFSKDNAGSDEILDVVLAEFQAQAQDGTAVRYLAEKRYVKKLRSFQLEEATSLSRGIDVKEKGVYLITGGAGGLGLIFAEYLAKEYKAKLVLTGRSELSKEREAKLSEMKSSGAEVLYLASDVSDREDVRKLINESKAHFGEINGIIHAAGVLRDSYVRNKKPEEMRAVFAPKIYGTLHLDEMTQNEDLDFFVMFSSVAAVAGNAGQCDYSFANHFMDSFAAARELLRAKKARSGKTLSLNWSLWADGGMKVDEQTQLYFKKTLGFKPLSKATGIEAFVKGLLSERSQFVVVEGVQEKVELAWGLRKKEQAPAISALASSGQAEAPIADGKEADLAAWLQKELSEIVMHFLKLEAEDVSTDKILLDLGFDSIGLTTFANTINEKYQLDITPVLFFDYPSIAEIAKYLSMERKNELLRFYEGSAGKTQTAPSEAVDPSASSQTAEDHQRTTFAISKGWNPSALEDQASLPISSGSLSPELRFVNQPIAIVGMSGVMPQSEDLGEFWDNLKNSKDMITVIPPDRWQWEDYYGDPLKEANKSNSKWGGFMKEIDKFDSLFFGISPREAQMMDPQQRLFLETVWKAIEDSGHKVSDLSGSRTGLFVGVGADDYAHLMNSLGIALDGYSASGNSHSVLANRVSFLLNLHGPSAPIDTACSSSLIALHRAIESIHTGSCDMAIVGGVQIMATPAGHISFGSAGMLSSDGKCKTFDKGANGYVRGEGCGAIFLKTLKSAEADGDHIYAVIKATAENHGGRVTTLTAPNSTAQAALLVEAYNKAHIDPTTVGYIECHGTGTSLGDPIEIQALAKAFSELYKKHKKPPAQTPHCGLSSVKTNIGHLETAAGIASVLKALLAIQHKEIPATINFEEINPYINLKGTPFYIADKLTPWTATTGENGAFIPRRAGVSSFGFGGANAHVVLEEYIPAKRRSPVRTQEPQLMVLSAKNEDRLKAYVQSILSFLERENVDLADFAYTLQIGRDEMPERLALVASSTKDLKWKIAEMSKGEKPKDCYRNNTRSKEAKSRTAEGAGGETLVRNLIEKKELSQLAELWVSGAKIDWHSLHQSKDLRRISVPTYPFARERHWLPGADGKTMKTRQETSPVEEAKPLLREEAKVKFQQEKSQSDNGKEKDTKAELQYLVPVWNRVDIGTGTRPLISESTKILLLGGEATQLDWLQRSCPSGQLLELAPAASVESINRELAECSFDQLLWIVPDAGDSGSEGMIEQQEKGVISVFRIIKALLQSGYAKQKLQWTIITARTQRVLENDLVQPAHAGIAGLVGSLAKEYPQWAIRIIDVDSLASVSARECLSLPWDKQGNGVAHRQGEWFQQELALMAGLSENTPIYRRNGVYVVIGGAGGIGEVWSRFMMENYQAKVVWIGRRKCDATIEEKINSLARLGPAPLYISADARNLGELEVASQTILKKYSAIHGIVQSAIVLQDESLARMEESVFRASLSAKVDVSVNMDRVFGRQELDFMLFFSSVISFFKAPKQANYAAGCTFKDGFAQKLQQERPYPVKIMNWGYWGSVGVAADEAYNQTMRQLGIGSIEPHEGMAFLQAFLNSNTSQMALIKTLNPDVTAGFAVAQTNRKTNDASRSEKQTQRMEKEGIEKTIMETLSEALKIDVEKIHNDVSVTEYGVDSIIGVNLVRTINEALDIDLPLKALFGQITVTDLVDLVSDLIAAKTEKSGAAPIQPINRAEFDRLPLSFSQERVWLFEQFAPGTVRYNVPTAAILHRELNIDQLEQAINVIIGRHESLRTVFPSEEGQARQQILESLDFKLERIDLRQYESREERDGKAKEICQADAAKPFDLARGPLLRGKVIQLAEQEHVLMINMHHIVTDGWSMGVFIHELDLITESLRQGRRPELPPLPIQYVDYVVWQRTQPEASGRLKEHLAYWQKKLTGVAESLDLAADYPRPSVQSFAGAAYGFAMDAELTGKLKNLAQRKGGTLYMTLLAAFKVLMHRYSGQSDICVGSLIANRQCAETEGLIGLFINTVALRNQVEGDDTFSALLSQVKATCLEAYEHQDAPFEKVVDMLHRDRNAAMNSLFRVMIVLHNLEVMEHRFPRYVFDDRTSELDIAFEFTDTAEGLTGSIEYSTVLYKPQTIVRMAEHFTALCRAITAAPTAKIRDLEYLSEGEKRRLLVEFNDTQAEYPRQKCIHDFFEEQVECNPRARAVVFGERELSYQELYERSGELGLYLQSLGVKPDSVVGLCVERSLEMMVGVMGIVRAGGAYLPADPANPDARLEYMLQDSQAAVVLTQERFRHKIKSLLVGDVRLVTLDKQWVEIGQTAARLKAEGVELRREVGPQNLSYLIYTSGSTGKPKGVLMEHRALVNRLQWMQKRYGLSKEDVVLQKTPYSFDVSVWELFWPMMAGASLVFAIPEGQKDVEYLEKLIGQAKVSTLHFVPSMLRSFVENAQGGCSSVRQIFCSGEALDKRSVDEYKRKFPNAELHNLYGPTEAAIDVTAYDCAHLDYPFVPIGGPIDNTQIYILDAGQHLQPIGVPGELHIGGDGLARGYLNRAELTREKFVANPFRPGERMYKTGDLARWLEDGTIQYLGRNNQHYARERRNCEINDVDIIESQPWKKILLPEAPLDDSNLKPTYDCELNVR